MLLEAAIDDPTGAGTRRGCLMANSTCELGNADPEVLDHAHRSYEASTALIGDCVVRAQREGDLPAEADPITLARAILAAQQGLVFMSRTGLDTATRPPRHDRSRLSCCRTAPAAERVVRTEPCRPG
ncbi:hypothetical protein GCM10022222_07160 [Amycolatopsis ultiminotia]|uniref:Tetracyclin repressor-like C-terminal domain-containing protein n=1 Tax=Amycolatopsis ultiminotia TaxID=543629 RepID=A0ABP6V110_9PSEU